MTFMMLYIIKIHPTDTFFPYMKDINVLTYLGRQRI